MRIQTPGAPDIFTDSTKLRTEPLTLQEEIQVEQQRLNDMVKLYKSGQYDPKMKDSAHAAIESQMAKVKKLHKKLEKRYAN